MAQPRSNSDDESSDFEDDETSSTPPSPIPAKPKQKVLPRLDLAGADKPARTRKITNKQAENEKDAEAKKDAKIANLLLQLKRQKKKTETAEAVVRERDAERAPPESEEEEEQPVQMSSFSNSFISKGVVAETAQKTAPKKLRRSGETPIVTPMSRLPLTNLKNSSNVTPDIRPRATPTPGDDEDVDADHDEPITQRRPTENTNTTGEGDEGHPESDPPPPLKHRKRRRRRSSSPSRSTKRAKVPPLTKAEFVTGKAPGGSRTNLKDYTEPAAKLIKRAMHRYEVRIWTKNPFPGAELQTRWVNEIWDEVCEEAEEHMELTERMASMIKKYGSHARSSLKDGIRPLVAPTYKFKVGDTDSILSNNTDIWKALLEDSAFHYEDPTTRTGFAKNTIIIEGMRGIFFKTQAGRGVLFFKYFSPITVVTLALIFTAIEFCINEYSTGRFQQGTFDELLNRARYDTHLKDLTDWDVMMPSVTAAIRQQMHDACRASTGAALIKPPGRLTDENRARALAELMAMSVDVASNDD